LRRM